MTRTDARFGETHRVSPASDKDVPVPILQASRTPQRGSELHRILRMEVPVIVRLAERKLAMSEVLRLGVGAILEFSKSSDEPLELLINNKVIGTGVTVKVGENFGLKIQQIGDVKAVIRSLGEL